MEGDAVDVDQVAFAPEEVSGIIKDGIDSVLLNQTYAEVKAGLGRGAAACAMAARGSQQPLWRVMAAQDEAATSGAMHRRLVRQPTPACLCVLHTRTCTPGRAVDVGRAGGLHEAPGGAEQALQVRGDLHHRAEDRCG
jgi:hypothetical protein